MKKSYVVISLFLFFVFSLSSACYAQYDETPEYEAYGICVASNVMEYDSNFKMNTAVDNVNYSKILKLWFNTDLVKEKNPTKSDFIYDLSKYVSEPANSSSEITSFKDFGFIKKEHRSAYKKLFSLGFLDFEDEFLEPNYPLTYEYMFKILKNFENEYKYANKVDITTGAVIDAYSSGKNIILKQSCDKKTVEYKFNRTNNFYVQSKTSIAPYSYNIERGATTKIYSKDGEIFFVSIIDKNNNINSMYAINKSKIFLCNIYDNEMIFLNNDNSFNTVKISDDVVVYKGNTPISLNDINSNYIDTNCYYIVDRETTTIKYINVTR